MKTNWQHQKDAINTDQAHRTDDEHINEEDKQELSASDRAAGQQQSRDRDRGVDACAFGAGLPGRATARAAG